MALASWRLFLQPTRVSLSTVSRSRIPLCERFEPLKSWIEGFEPALKNRVLRSSEWKMRLSRCYGNNFCKSGMKFGMASVFGVSVALGSICLRPHMVHAIDGFDILGHDHRVGLPSPMDEEEDPQDVLVMVRKLMLPAFLFVTVLVNWGYPIILVAKIILILFGTKPRPFSVYLFIEQLRQQFIHRQPLLYKIKSLYAKKVEVEDYKILCLARVELNNREFTLIGILGSWWVLPWSTSQEALSIPRTKFWRSYIRN